jgi:hypothetical protein
MEFLVVRFPERRKVRVDGIESGKTGELIELAAGTYTITLDPAGGCAPPAKTIVLQDTAALDPCEVIFARA